MLIPLISKPSIGRRLRRQQDALNVARDLQIVIEPLLFIRFRVDDRVVEREGRLLGDRFEDDEIARRERARSSGRCRRASTPMFCLP